MSTTPDGRQASQDDKRESTRETASQRGTDDRRETVDPAQNPAPRSPEPDQDSIEKGEETLERVKPY